MPGRLANAEAGTTTRQQDIYNQRRPNAEEAMPVVARTGDGHAISTSTNRVTKSGPGEVITHSGQGIMLWR